MIAGNATNILVCEKVMGLKMTKSLLMDGVYFTNMGPLKDYSNDWEYAMQVRDVMRLKNFSMRKRFTESLQKIISHRLSHDMITKIHESEIILRVTPLDICEAALAAHAGDK